MISDLITGVKKAICDYFGEKYEIYTNQHAPDTQKSYFFVGLSKQENTRLMGTRFRRKYSIEIKFTPKDLNWEESESVSDALYLTLEYISAAGDTLRGSAMASRIESGVLTFNVDYTVFGYTKSSDELMREVTINGSIKE